MKTNTLFGILHIMHRQSMLLLILKLVGTMKATSSFADEDWDDIEMTVPTLEDFNDTQPTTKVIWII